MKRLFSTVTFLFLFAFISTPLLAEEKASKADEKPTKDALLDALLAHEKQIKSATFAYKHGSLTSKKYVEGKLWDWPKGEPRSSVELTIAEKEWVLRWPGYPNTSMCRSDFAATYYETPQPAGDIYRSFIITDPGGVCKSIENEKEENRLYALPSAGALPSEKLVTFLKKNRDRIEYGGEEKINGYSTHVLRICILKNEFSEIMNGINPEYLKRNEMVISFYVAPELANALVRIEESTINGLWTQRYDAVDFTEVAKGIFFPKQYMDVSKFYRKEESYYINQYEVSEISNVNAEIPKTFFEMDLPKGTRVSDSRTGRGDSVVVTDREITFFKPDDLIIEALTPKK
ncbi:MAG: hypothetical protein ACRC2T_15415 [Thermoguttaceae bacterium]